MNIIDRINRHYSDEWLKTGREPNVCYLGKSEIRELKDLSHALCLFESDKPVGRIRVHKVYIYEVDQESFFHVATLDETRWIGDTA